ncbi:MAG: ABC transporter permease [Erysipelotrichaceae bacterium]|nr:ABC transporter permease [Erysipelotrichaceae bacterium]
MEQLYILTSRNLKIYFRDKASVFFSLLSMLIIIFLMTFFLGDVNVNSIIDGLSQLPNRNTVTDKTNAELLIYLWSGAGILSINSITVTISVYSALVRDKVSAKISSIYTSPMSRTMIALSYIVSAWIASVFVCFVTLIVFEMIGLTKGLSLFSFITHLKIIGLILINSLTYTSLMYFIVQFVKSEGAWSGIGTVISTLVGFLGGIYVPIGSLSSVIVNLIQCTPVIYGTAMFREVMCEDIMNTLFDGVSSDIVSIYSQTMGIQLTLFNQEMTLSMELCIMLICAILFMLLSVCLLKYTHKTDR